MKTVPISLSGNILKMIIHKNNQNAVKTPIHGVSAGKDNI